VVCLYRHGAGRTDIKLRFRFRKTATETNAMLEYIHGNEAPSHRSLGELFRRLTVNRGDLRLVYDSHTCMDWSQ